MGFRRGNVDLRPDPTPALKALAEAVNGQPAPALEPDARLVRVIGAILEVGTGATAATWERERTPRKVRVVRVPPQGPARSFSEAVHRARGPYDRERYGL